MQTAGRRTELVVSPFTEVPGGASCGYLIKFVRVDSLARTLSRVFLVWPIGRCLFPLFLTLFSCLLPFLVSPFVVLQGSPVWVSKKLKPVCVLPVTSAGSGTGSVR